ncbi:MAG TPA: DNA-processing protein DprA [Candidatus Paceibacterota bacterium]|nr:DNA-processing protein DprA [Candidatus Paceibacterota bacterium]
MEFPITKVVCSDLSPLLVEIPDAPTHLYVRGELSPTNKRLAVVGSRNYSNYGKQAVERLIEGLRGYPVSVVSGLALGIDALAHEAALRAHLHTIAVPGSGIADRVIYPRRNRGLAARILESGGALVSEFEPDFEATPWSFPKRNRIMAGLSHAVLLIEASERSGTLITARLAADFNREVLVVPGSIFSENSHGVHQFLKLGATPVTSPDDIIDALGFAEHVSARTTPPVSDDESAVLAVLSEPRDHDSIIRLLPFPRERTLVLLMEMELAGLVRDENGIVYRAD